jgi:predicted ribosome quality control (RQC) complex YloA/Tae2 family protein
MHVDFLTLACLRDDLDGLLGARVQRIVLPDEHSVGMELYVGRRVHLLLSADPQNPRVLLVPERQRRGVETATPLLQLMRKWVRGAHLIDVTQPPWERILTLHFDGRVGSCRLVIEAIGRYANVILVGPDDRVLEAVKRVGPDQNRYRVTLPNHPYQPPPPPPNRRPPTAVTPAGWRAEFASVDGDTPLRRLLVRRVFAVSPTAAREIAARVAGDPEAPAAAADAAAVAAAIADLFSPLDDGSWAPNVALDETGDVVAFAPYEPRQFDRVSPAPSISVAMARYFEARLPSDPYAAARRRVKERIDAVRGRIDHALEQLESQRVDPARIDTLREAGELLLTYQHRVSPGDSEVTLPDYEGQPRAIELDPRLTPVENAQRYFVRYEKAQRASRKVPARIATHKVDRLYLEQLATDLALAETRPEIDAVRQALADAGWGPKPRQRAGRPSGPRRFDLDGFTVLVGRNARQNDAVTFEHAGPHDLWLHVRGLPGAHVVILRGKQAVPEETIRRAAALAAYYSLARKEGLVLVNVTERRFVRRAPGDRPGLVSYREERTVEVQGASPDEVGASEIRG